MVVSPRPSAVRRSTAPTSVSLAGISGWPGRSERRKTTPVPAAAGRNVATVFAPVCRPVPESDVFCLTDRLGLGIGRAGRNEFLELVHDLREAIQRGLGPQRLAVRPCRDSGHGLTGVEIAVETRLRGHARFRAETQ